MTHLDYIRLVLRQWYVSGGGRDFLGDFVVYPRRAVLTGAQWSKPAKWRRYRLWRGPASR